MAQSQQHLVWEGKETSSLFTEMAAFAHGNTNLEHTKHALIVLAEDEPANYRKAMNSPNANKWCKACKLEYETLLRYHTSMLINRPLNTNIVGSRWTFRVKCDNLGDTDTLKSRLVTQGFSQIPGLDFNETYSPMIILTSIHLILALTCRYDLQL